MHDIRPEKAGKVAELKDLLSSSKGAVLVDYCGLTVAEDTELRSKMREAGVKYMVAKNTFIRIAAKEAGIEGLDAYLEHNTAVAFSAEDPVAPAKILNDFSKDHKALEIKAGILDGKVIAFQRRTAGQTGWQHAGPHFRAGQRTAGDDPQLCVYPGSRTAKERAGICLIEKQADAVA